MTQEELIKYAIKKGYHSNEDGNIFSKKNILHPYSGNKYLKFGIRIGSKTFKIKVHRFVGYELYGDVIFKKGIDIRHLDGNSHNNAHININYGTKSQNAMDKTEETRKRCAKIASNSVRKYSDEVIAKLKEDRTNGMKYSQLHTKYGMSKSTLSYYLS